MEEKINYLPLGSVVVVHGGVKKYVIVARGLQLMINGEKKFFDYGGCMYPEGMVGDKLMYFQHKDITKCIFEGFKDDDNELMVANIQEAIAEAKLVHADVRELKTSLEN